MLSGNLRELSLFHGAGGGILASRLLGWRTVCGVEFDPYRRRVVAQRQADGLLDPFDMWDDVRTFDGKPWRGRVDVVSGGFPCPAFSLAGKRLGGADPRNMWPDTARVIGDVRPRYAFPENVPGLLSSGYFGRVLGDLAALGYGVVWDCVSASHVGAPHRRDRLWILAYSDAPRLQAPGRQLEGPGRSWPEPITDSQGGRGRSLPDVAHSEQARCEAPHGSEELPGWRESPDVSRWLPEPDVDRVAARLPSGVDRLEALGDAQVPLVAALAFRRLEAAARRIARTSRP